MNIRTSYRHTLTASYIGYVTQAIVNNFAPLLFLTFQRSYNIPLGQITLLVTLNFGIQLLVDLLSARFVDKIGYRVCIVGAHLFAAVGLVGLGTLPNLLPNPFAGLVVSVCLYAIGGGIIEVLISPIVEACPTDKKSAAMSLLHSFYCWGHVLVVLLSTLFFVLAGTQSWPVLAIAWAIIPAFNAFYFMLVPIAQLNEGGKGLSIKQLLSSRLFWVFALLMVCAGASEQGMSQWASTFAEAGLGVSKTIGDLTGPCLFAIFMGSARALYAKFSERLNLQRFMVGSALLCVVCYLLAALSPWPILALAGCAFCGFTVGIMWPGTFSLAAEKLPGGGTAMFAFFALAGDLGCSGGPTLVGFMAGVFGGQLRLGLLAAIIFPVLLILGLILCARLTGGKAQSK